LVSLVNVRSRPSLSGRIYHVHSHRTGQGKIGACGAVGIAGESEEPTKRNPRRQHSWSTGDFSVLDRLGSQADDNGYLGEPSELVKTPATILESPMTVNAVPSERSISLTESALQSSANRLPPLKAGCPRTCGRRTGCGHGFQRSRQLGIMNSHDWQCRVSC